MKLTYKNFFFNWLNFLFLAPFLYLNLFPNLEFLILLGSSINFLGIYYFLKQDSYQASPWFYFYVTFFIFYLLGPFLSVISYQDPLIIFNTQTTFSNVISSSAVNETFIYLFVFLCCLNFLVFNFSGDMTRSEISALPLLTNISLLLMTVILPLMLYFKISYISSISNYQDIYLARAWTPLNLLSFANSILFLIFIASKPKINLMRVILFLQFLVVATDLYLGYRSGLIVFIMLSFWILAYLYGYKVKIFQLTLFAIIGIMILFYVELSRNQLNIELDLIFRFLLSSLSKAAYTTALYIDNREIVDALSPNSIFYPLYYVIDYIIYGGDVVGQSSTSAELRKDMNHVLSSSLNYGAYLSGAGTGSALIAEIYQQRPFFILFSIGFFLFYEFIFSQSRHKRLFLYLSIFTFQHLIFSPRDTFFPFFWGYIRIIIPFFLVFLIYNLLRNSRKRYV